MTAKPLPSLPIPPNRKPIRKAMGLTLEQAASQIGVSARTYLRWEQGSTPNPENHRKYSAQLEKWISKIN